MARSKAYDQGMRSFPIVLLTVLALGVPSSPAQLPFPGTNGAAIGFFLPVGFEPSGAAWHPRLHRLFLASDDGRVASVKRDGSAPQVWTIGSDFEGVCIADPASPFIYLGIEDPDAILEFNIETATVTRLFNLTAVLTSANSSRGLEALTFVPDASNPEGGLFYTGLQETGQIHRFQLPIRSSATFTGFVPMGFLNPTPILDDLSGIDYHPETGDLFAIYDSHDRLRRIDLNGTVQTDWLILGNDNEGLALHGCEAFFAIDNGSSVSRFQNIPGSAFCHPLQIDEGELSLAAGGLQTMTLDAGLGAAGGIYAVIGSLSGTEGGPVVGGVQLPLFQDFYFNLTVSMPNSPPLSTSFGFLDGSGGAVCSFTLPAGSNAALAGWTLHHAAVVVVGSSLTLVSNPVL